MRLNLCHVLLDGQLLALEEARLLASIDVQRRKCVREQVRPAVVIITLNDDIRQCGWLLLYFLRVL